MKKVLIAIIIASAMTSCFSSQSTCATYVGSSHNGKTYHAGTSHKFVNK